MDKVAKSGELRLAPLANMPIVRDLVADMREFFDKWARAKGQFTPTATRADAFAAVDPHSAPRREADAGIECIGCGVCYAACDVVKWNRDYLGPAALNRAWTLVNDVRDGGQHARLRAVAGDAGCHSCHTMMSCTELCPKELSPTRSIAGLKRATLGIAIFYGAFVIAASLHGAIGLRTVGMEWLRLRETPAGMLALAVGLALCALGMRAVFAVVAA